MPHCNCRVVIGTADVRLGQVVPYQQRYPRDDKATTTASVELASQAGKPRSFGCTSTAACLYSSWCLYCAVVCFNSSTRKLFPNSSHVRKLLAVSSRNIKQIILLTTRSGISSSWSITVSAVVTVVVSGVPAATAVVLAEVATVIAGVVVSTVVAVVTGVAAVVASVAVGVIAVVAGANQW